MRELRVVIEPTLIYRLPLVHQVQQYIRPMLDARFQSLHLTFEMELLVVEQHYA